MASLSRLFDKSVHFSRNAAKISTPLKLRNFSSKPEPDENEQQKLKDDDFRVLNLRQTKQPFQKRRQIKKDQPLPPRSQQMHVDQDWGAVWPGPRSFHPATVPLPLRQGFTEKNAAPPSKYANAELMKIPNFLHLTPPVIKKHCEALKQFCTQWPEGLETDEKCEKSFPLEVTTADYCHALPTIRNPLARVVKLNIRLSTLKFDEHARDKFLRLVGDRYDPETDILTIQTDRCPLKRQNYDYAMYLLTACYHESFIKEPWENTKSLADMEFYDFNENQSKKSVEKILNWNHKDDEQMKIVPKEFGITVQNLINDGENKENLKKYKEQVLKMFGLQK